MELRRPSGKGKHPGKEQHSEPSDDNMVHFTRDDPDDDDLTDTERWAFELHTQGKGAWYWEDSGATPRKGKSGGKRGKFTDELGDHTLRLARVTQ